MTKRHRWDFYWVLVLCVVPVPVLRYRTYQVMEEDDVRKMIEKSSAPYDEIKRQIDEWRVKRGC